MSHQVTSVLQKKKLVLDGRRTPHATLFFYWTGRWKSIRRDSVESNALQLQSSRLSCDIPKCWTVTQQADSFINYPATAQELTVTELQFGFETSARTHTHEGRILICAVLLYDLPICHAMTQAYTQTERRVERTT